MTDLERPSWQLVIDERRDIAAFLRELPPEQWATPSLCAGWTVKDVAAHLLLDEPVYARAPMPVLALVVRERFSVTRLNAHWVERHRRRSPEDLIRSFEQDTVKRVGLLGHLIGPAVALRALMIHDQDMRRPLHLTREIPRGRLVVALEALMTWKGNLEIGSRKRARGVRLQADDVRWSHGDGPVVRGPGEAILMALGGRGAALADLAGDGKGILAGRMGPAAEWL